MAEYSAESHTIRIHPKLWEWAQADAQHQGYSSAAALISGLILYNHTLRDRKHWLTPDLVSDMDQLEAAMKEIEHHNPMEKGMTWFEHQIEERLGPKPGEE